MWRLSGDMALARGDRPPRPNPSPRSGRARGTPAHAQYHLPLARLDTELRLAQDGPAEALAVVEDAIEPRAAAEPRYTWPMLAAGARACAAAAARDGALPATARGAAIGCRRGRPLPPPGWLSRPPATFAAETDSGAWLPRPSAAWDDGGAGLGGGRPALPAGGALVRAAEAARATATATVAPPGCAGPRRWPTSLAPGRCARHALLAAGQDPAAPDRAADGRRAPTRTGSGSPP